MPDVDVLFCTHTATKNCSKHILTFLTECYLDTQELAPGSFTLECEPHEVMT